jgi:hypothetical protein
MAERRRRIGLAMALIFAAACAAPRPPEPAAAVQPDATDIFVQIEGTWGWLDEEASCERNPHTIEFDAERTTMTLRHEEPLEMHDGSVRREARYRVIGQAENRVRLSLDDEVQRDDDGELVVWELVALSTNHYCWFRLDWPADTCTQPIERC